MKRKVSTNSMAQFIWPFCLILMLIGLLLFPIHMRDPVFRSFWSSKYSLNNYFMTLAVILLMATKRQYSQIEIGLCFLWITLLIPIFMSNISRLGVTNFHKTLTALMNNWAPVYLIVQRFQEDKRKKYLKIVLIVVDVFTLILLAMAIYQKITRVLVLEKVVEYFTARGIKTSEYSLAITQWHGPVGNRTFSFWGLPLTNALLFNAFFVMNDIYYRSIQKRYPKLIFFGITLVGELLCASKMALIVLAVYLVVTSWQNKKWLLIFLAALVPAYFLGLFNAIVYRLQTTSFTSGRWRVLVEYFNSDVAPLKFWIGYGTGMTYTKAVKPLKFAFEPPLMMFSLDYGILFAILFIGSIFAYFTYEMLKRKQVASWLGLTLFFAQVNTYNGMSLRNQDVCWMILFVIMICLNAVSLRDKQENIEPALKKEKGLKGILTFIVCG